ncbi:MAG: AmmeMemoRadiSam system radical SAM enzyme [Candidatus Hodarchaeales archaeon]
MITTNQDDEWKFYKVLSSGKVQCSVCPRHCTLSENEIGWCGARWHKEGKILPRTYSLVSSIAIDPIEKKPLYHFLPGTGILSIGSHGCNMGCLHCQNYSISMERSISHLRKVTPRELVATAKEKNIPSIASTYNEPMIAYEYLRDIAIEAHKIGIKIVTVDNGYITKRLAEKMAPFIDAANIDIKGFSDKFYKEICQVSSWQSVLETCKIFKNKGVHVEITNLIIPTKNDSVAMITELSEWVYNNLGADTPLHFSRFHPDYKLRNLPYTPLRTLEKAYKIAKEVGLNYIYLGNVRSDLGNNTYCPSCGNLLIERSGYYTKIIGLGKDGKCNNCSLKIPVIL